MPNNPRGQQPAKPSAPLSPELIEKFLDAQKEDLQLRVKQLALDTQREENNRHIAQTAIDAQVKDRENERGHIERRAKIIFFGSAALVIIILVFCGFALFIGKESVVLKIAEIGIIFAAGFTSGYGVKTARTPKKEDR